MKTFQIMLLSMLLTACAATHELSLPADGYGMEGVNVGDRVRIVMIDGNRHNILVNRVDETGLHGSEGSFPYGEMRSVNATGKRAGNQNLLWLLLSIAAVAAFAEPDSGGSGPFCLRSSNGGPCLP